MLAGELEGTRAQISVATGPRRPQRPRLCRRRGFAAEQRGAIKALEHASSFIRHNSRASAVRRVPDLHFSLDNSQEYTRH